MLKIRLQRVGRKNDPSYRVVVAPSTMGPKSGNTVELLGSYDPRKEKDNAVLKADRIKHWIGEGAQVSGTVHNLLVREHIIEGNKVNVLPKKKPIVKEEQEEKAEKAEKDEGETPKEENKSEKDEETTEEKVSEAEAEAKEGRGKEVKEELNTEEKKEESKAKEKNEEATGETQPEEKLQEADEEDLEKNASTKAEKTKE